MNSDILLHAYHDAIKDIEHALGLPQRDDMANLTERRTEIVKSINAMDAARVELETWRSFLLSIEQVLGTTHVGNHETRRTNVVDTARMITTLFGQTERRAAELDIENRKLLNDMPPRSWRLYDPRDEEAIPHSQYVAVVGVGLERKSGHSIDIRITSPYAMATDEFCKLSSNHTEPVDGAYFWYPLPLFSMIPAQFPIVLALSAAEKKYLVRVLSSMAAIRDLGDWNTLSDLVSDAAALLNVTDWDSDAYPGPLDDDKWMFA